MGEADAFPVELDHVAVEGGREPLAGSSSGGVAHELEGRVRQCGGGQQRGPRIVRKQREPVAHQRASVPGNGSPASSRIAPRRTARPSSSA